MLRRPATPDLIPDTRNGKRIFVLEMLAKLNPVGFEFIRFCFVSLVPKSQRTAAKLDRVLYNGPSWPFAE